MHGVGFRRDEAAIARHDVLEVEIRRPFVDVRAEMAQQFDRGRIRGDDVSFDVHGKVIECQRCDANAFEI